MKEGRNNWARDRRKDAVRHFFDSDPDIGSPAGKILQWGLTVGIVGGVSAGLWNHDVIPSLVPSWDFTSLNHTQDVLLSDGIVTGIGALVGTAILPITIGVAFAEMRSRVPILTTICTIPYWPALIQGGAAYYVAKGTRNAISTIAQTLTP